MPFPEVRLLRPTYQAAKRILDVSLSLLLLPLLLPLMAICAALILCDDGGPVIFAQWRTGRGGRRFRMFKFRTMVKNAEDEKRKYLHLNKMSGAEFKIVDDPRITRFGRFLRRSSFDELPQIFNVLKGEMSLVGPRPTSFAVEKYDLWQTERLEVLPGITGLAQVSGRSQLPFEEKLRCDIEYVESRTIWLDLCILARTTLVLLTQRGAC